MLPLRYPRGTMSGPMATLAGALLLAALSTLGDFVWARFIPRHRVLLGLTHGVLLLMSLGAWLGLHRHRPGFGATGGALVGLAAAGGFYATAPLLGSSALFPSWMALWIGFAFLDARMRGGLSGREILARGALAAGGSGLAFYAISGIWTRPSSAGPSYAFHFVCWTVAFLPGFAALLLGPGESRTR
jgi:hypothetical protein